MVNGQFQFSLKFTAGAFYDKKQVKILKFMMQIYTYLQTPGFLQLQQKHGL